jgi:imidazole glycerol-phosphate synthase subunit HisH
MITIVDFGTSNAISVKNMLNKIGFESTLANNGDELSKASKVIMPGVGSFDSVVNNMDNLGFREILNNKVLDDKIPILGICLGMQIMTRKSEEGQLTGLSWIDGEAKKFDFTAISQKLKTPHMGWNYVKVINNNSLFPKTDNKQKFYFAHSYFVELDSDRSVISTQTNYGRDFVSSFSKDNIYGVQFHPEKSHRYGLSLLNNFCVL